MSGDRRRGGLAGALWSLLVLLLCLALIFRTYLYVLAVLAAIITLSYV